MTVLSERFDRALVAASAAHRGQTRKGSQVPYLTHPLAVCAMVGEHGGNEDQLIAALLHDAVEDGGMSAEAVREQFGARVAAIVAACTEPQAVPKLPWTERKTRYLEQLAQAGPEARLVAAADKLHNARAIVTDLQRIGPAVWARFSANPDAVCGYFRRAVETLRGGWQHPILDELKRAVEALEAFK